MQAFNRFPNVTGSSIGSSEMQKVVELLPAIGQHSSVCLGRFVKHNSRYGTGDRFEREPGTEQS